MLIACDSATRTVVLDEVRNAGNVPDRPAPDHDTNQVTVAVTANTSPG